MANDQPLSEALVALWEHPAARATGRQLQGLTELPFTAANLLNWLQPRLQEPHSLEFDDVRNAYQQLQVIILRYSCQDNFAFEFQDSFRRSIASEVPNQEQLNTEAVVQHANANAIGECSSLTNPSVFSELSTSSVTNPSVMSGTGVAFPLRVFRFTIDWFASIRLLFSREEESTATNEGAQSIITNTAVIFHRICGRTFDLFASIGRPSLREEFGAAPAISALATTTNKGSQSMEIDNISIVSSRSGLEPDASMVLAAGQSSGGTTNSSTDPTVTDMSSF